MTRHMFDQTIIRLRAAEISRDKLGQPVRDWANATRLAIPQVSVQPQGSTESVSEPRDRRVSRWEIQSRGGQDLDVVPTDRIEWRDMVLEIVGEVLRWPHPIRPGRVHHAVISVQRVEG